MAKKSKKRLTEEQARIDTMVESVRAMQLAHDQWANDGSKNPRPTDVVLRAMANCIGLVLRGGEHYPKTATLCQAAMRLETHLQEFADGDHHPVNGSPRPHFWNAYLKVIEASAGMAEPEYRPPEPVLRMHQQGANHNAIAKEWGWRDAQGNWSGPFWGVNHELRPDLIEQQIAYERGDKDVPAVIPDDFEHPGRVAVYKRELAESERQLNEVREALQADMPYEESATITELLLEGQFVHKIAKLKNVSEDEVSAVAGSMNLVPCQEHDPRTWAEQFAAQRDRIREPSDDAGEDEPPPKPQPMPDDKLREAVQAIRKADTDGQMDAGAIARQLSEQFEAKVTVQDVARVLKE